MYICLMKVRDYLRRTMASKSNKATKQAKKQAPKVSPRSGVAPPVDKQFGRPGGNPRHNGAWKKEESARGKFEMWIKMTEKELTELLEKENIASFDESTINLVLQLQKMTRLLREMVTKLDKEKDIEKKIKLTSYCTNQLETIMIITEKLSNQIYGQPKQLVENHNIEYKPLVDLTKRKKNGGEK